MNDEYKQLYELRDKFVKLLEEYPNIGIFFVLIDHSNTTLPCVIAGDECPICSINDLVKWANDRNIQHFNHETKEERIH